MLTEKRSIYKYTTLLSLLFLFISSSLFTSCKNEFEALRLSNNDTLKYQKAIEFYDNKDYQKAQYLFEDLMGTNLGLTERAEKVYFYYAYTHYYLENFMFSSYYFKRFYNTFTTSEFAEEALFMSAQSSYQLSPTYRLTQEDTKDAIEGFQLFANTYPESDRIETCNKKIDELRVKLEQKALEAAKGYFKRKRYRAALHSFNSLLIDFPGSENSEEIRYMIVKASYRYAQESILSKQVERYNETIDHAQTFNKRHAESSYAKEVATIVENCNLKIKKITQ